ncbi:MAG: GNAT family N-acetyltransferase [Piscirickettsiaceae bacterium]|nr:MAG: GNAT family N-acetyltransferase [Piscirickettsiaceae bacterium]
MDCQLLPISAFEHYEKQWDTLNTAGPNTPVLSTNFVKPLLHHFGTQKEKLVVFGSTEKPTALAVIVKDRFGSYITFQPSQAPIGLWVQDAHANTAELLAVLFKKLPITTMVFGLTQQDPDLMPRPEKQGHVSTLDYIETGRVSLNKSFDEYWAERGKNLRQNLNRQRNRLEREDVERTLKTLTNPDDVIEAIKQYGVLETAGWKNDQGTAIHVDNAQGKFYISMLQTFCNEGNGIIYQYFYNQELVATDLCIRNENQLIILKTTYNEDISTSSPAMLMRKESFPPLFEEKKSKTIEFYGKVMNWHTKWTKEIRTMYHINFKRF